MSLNPKSPLLKKRAMDALLESMTTDSYDSLGAHRRGESTPESKGTEFDSLNQEGFQGAPAIIPPKDLAPPSSPEEAEFFKESEPVPHDEWGRPVKTSAVLAAPSKEHPIGTSFEDMLAEVSPVEEEKAEHEFFKQAPVEKTAGHRVKDTGEYDEEKEARIRAIAKETAQYYEHGQFFDPKGDYLCKGCHYMLGNKACAFVEGDIDKEFGTCRFWKVADGKAPVELERKYDKKLAGYAERKPKAGFGCKRCEYGFGAKTPDSDGRESWCEFFGMHIEPDACCYENEEHGDILFNSDNTVNKQGSFVSAASLAKSATRILYHVTPTNKVDSIRAKGILPLQTSNWVKGQDGERYGEGEIFAMDNPADAIRWAAKMDWEFNKGMGTGKITIIAFRAGSEKWKTDTSDPISQAANKGKWLKAVGSIKPEQIVGAFVLEPEMVKNVIQNKPVKLGGKPKCPHCGSGDYGLMPSDFETAKCNSCGKNWDHGIVDGVNNPYEKTADVPTKSYGMGTPIGGTDNPDAGASDEPEELQDPGELSLNMTGSEDDWEYDDYDYDAEDARLAALMDEEDAAHDGQARLWASEVDGNDWHVALEKIGSTEDSGWFSKSARPTDQKIELLQKQFKLTPEQLELAISADPSQNQTDYVAWIAKQFAKKLINLPEDTEKIRGQLEKFTKYKRSPSFTFNKDIQQYDPAKLYETIEQAEAAGMGSKKEQKRETVRAGAELVINQGDVKIYKVTTPEAARELGSGTNWCTAAPGSDYAAHYLKDGPLYIFFDAGSAVAQLHPESNQFMNRADVCILENVRGGDYGRYNDKTEQFLADPSLAKALGLLAAKEPSVKTWVEEHVTSPEKVLEILGEESAKEIEHNTQYEQSLEQYKKDLAEYEQKVEEYNRQMEAWNQTPAMQEFNRKQEEYEKKLEEYYKLRDAYYENRQGEHPQVPHRPGYGDRPEGEPEQPRQPYNPAERSNRGYGYGREDSVGKRFKYQVRNAMATGTPLPPEIEQQLVGAGVNTQLLLKYGALFHPGQPWEPLAQSILSKVKSGRVVDKDAIDYAAKFVKGRWPDIEPYLLDKLFLQTRNMERMRTALDYAARAVRGRWPEFEEKLMKAKPGIASGYGAAEYAIRAMKMPWSSVPGIKRKKNGKTNPEECMTIGNPGEARRYAEAFFQGKRWEDFETSALKANNLAALINYAADTLKARMPELEEKILSGQKDSQEGKGRRRWDRKSFDLPLDYAVKVIKGRWPEYEAKVLDAAKVMESRGHGSEYKPSHGEHNSWNRGNNIDSRISNYIEQVVGGRWAELETVLLERYQTKPEDWVQNQYMIDGYLTAVSTACQNRYKDNTPVPEPAGNEPLEEGQPWQRPARRNERIQKPYTKFQQDAQCYWAEGEKRLITRDPGYEQSLMDELKAHTQDKQRMKEDKFVSPENLAKMERPAADADIDYKSRDTKPDYTVWNGMWIGWYGMDEIEHYVDYMLANNQTWDIGVDIMELHEDLEDVRGRYSYARNRPQRRQKELQFTSSLLKNKRALVEMHESPTVLPPRDDIKQHLDQQVQDQLTKDVMQGVTEPLNPKRKQRRPQINPNINPDGVVAALSGTEVGEGNVLPGPLDKIKKYLKVGIDPEVGGIAVKYNGSTVGFIGLPVLDVVPGLKRWLENAQQNDANVTWDFLMRDAKHAADEDEEAQYFLEQMEDAADEAKRYFMQEAYIQQLAEENSKTMDEMWDMMGEEYAAEFYGVPYKRVPDFTDEETPNEDPIKRSASGSQSEIRIRFKGKEEVYPIDPHDVMKAVRHAENLSMANPGFPVVFIIDEEGVVTEDTYINGNHVGETVEKFAFRATR